jgi:putative endonuclease
MNSTKARGDAAESLAASHLERAGLRVLERNVIAGGVELDMICLGGAGQGVDRNEGSLPTYVFVEVRSRHGEERGHPLETIDRRKRGRMLKGATAWLTARGLWERVYVRFDVVTVVGGAMDGQGAPGRVEWISSAFEA